MGSYREDCIRAKAIKAGIIELRPVSGKNGKAKPVALEYRLVPGHQLEWLDREKNRGRWRKWKSYRTLEEAQIAAENLRRKHPTLWEFRIPAEVPSQE